MGGDLTHIGSKRDRGWLARWIKNPQALKPGTTMPTLGVSDADASALAAYLFSLK